jgi:hypothetical protein
VKRQLVEGQLVDLIILVAFRRLYTNWSTIHKCITGPWQAGLAPNGIR